MTIFINQYCIYFTGSGNAFGIGGGNSGHSFLENKMNLLSGGVYGSRYPMDRPIIPPNGPFPPPQSGGLLPPELEAKVGLLLPLAGAALLGIAAYAIVTNPGIAMAAGPVAYGKRRKRSILDDKLEQLMAYRAHHQK